MGRGIIESGLFRTERLGLEVRTTDPATTGEGDAWIRSDVAPDTDQIATLRFDDGASNIDVPIFSAGTSGSNVSEALPVQLNGSEGFIPITDVGGTYSQLRIQHNSATYEFHDALTAIAAIPDSGIFYYNYEDEGTLNAVDQWNNNDGTINGTTYTTDAYAGSHALSFDGVDDNVSLPSGLFGTSAFSVAFWAYPTGVEGSRDTTVTLKADIDTDIRVTTGGNWQFGLFDGSNFNTCTASYTANTWQHIVCTYDGSTAIIYKDGSQADSVSTGLVTKSDASYLGATADLSVFYNGRLDETKTYDKALTSTEVADLYNNGSI